MNKSIFSFIIDFIFYSFLIFFVSFIWLRLYIHNNTLIIVLSSLITLILSFVLSIIYAKKVNKFKLNKKEKKEKNELLNKLIFMNNLEINEFLSKFYSENIIKKHREFLEIKNDEENFLVFNFYSFNVCDNSFLLEAVKKASKLKVKNLIIFASNFDKNCKIFIKNIKEYKIKLINFDNFYINYIKKENIIVSSKVLYEEKSKYTFKELLNIAFNKNKTKSYVVTGIIFLISSIFLRYNIYYIVFTTLMFIFALFSYFNKPFNKKINEN